MPTHGSKQTKHRCISLGFYCLLLGLLTAMALYQHQSILNTHFLDSTPFLESSSMDQKTNPISLSIDEMEQQETKMIDLVSLNMRDDFYVLFENRAVDSWVRHISNIRSITFIGRETDFKLWRQNMAIYYPHLTVPHQWINETHWMNKYRIRFGCGYPKVCQQLIKLHVFDLKYDLGVPLSDSVLIVDSDTVWSRNVEFLHSNVRVKYFAEEGDPACHDGMDPIAFQERFTAGPPDAINELSSSMPLAPYPWCHRTSQQSTMAHHRHEFSFRMGERHINHHMLFQEDVMQDLHTTLSKLWKTESLWEAIVQCFVNHESCQGRVSEYELYFSWVFHRFHSRVDVEYLQNKASVMQASAICNAQEMECCRQKQVLLKGCHSHRINAWNRDHSKVGDMCCQEKSVFGIGR